MDDYKSGKYDPVVRQSDLDKKGAGCFTILAMVAMIFAAEMLLLQAISRLTRIEKELKLEWKYLDGRYADEPKAKKP